jgi:hypothetical protein
MQLPATWQSVPAQAQHPATAQIQGALPQAGGVVYPLQQFQLSPQVRAPSYHCSRSKTIFKKKHNSKNLINAHLQTFCELIQFNCKIEIP